jgi:putative CocE/NonD family hydrolase
MRVRRWSAVCRCVCVGGLGLVAWHASAQTALTRLPAPVLSASDARELAGVLKAYDGPKYERFAASIPMRDGVSLYTTILRPVGSDTSGPPLPFLMKRTPYGIDDSDEIAVEIQRTALARSGYLFVFQDIRGRYKSGGKFVMNRPIVTHTAKTDIDETTDTRDTIDWLLKNVPNNSGKVGVYGVSYPGFLAMMAGIDAHPAVKAISPQAPMTDIWLGDDFFHNGAFRESYGFDYVQELEAQKTDATVSSKEDQYKFFLDHTNFAGAAAAAGMSDLPTAKEFLSHPAYVKFWQDMAVEAHLGRPEVPTLEVGGYWDQEDMWGTQAEYAALRAHEAPDAANTDPQHRVFLVLGPWNHGAWAHGTGSTLGGKFGSVPLGSDTSIYFRDNLDAPFFELYLKGRPGFDLADTASFRTGENAWHRYAIWPPQVGYHAANLYLAPQKSLTLAAPAAGAAGKAAVYLADPADPVPYRHRPIQSTYGQNSMWSHWLSEDQSFVATRNDVATFSTPALATDVTITGDVLADLFAATTGTDGDWVVKLIDQYPDGSQHGYELMVAEEILRGRYRNSFTSPQPVKPDEVNEYKWSLHGVDHTFLKGHHIMVQVQSSWFPLYDRNPQTYVDNIMSAPASAYKAETISIYGSAKYPSHLVLPLADGSNIP